MKKNKIENFTSIMNYINDYEKEISWFDLVLFALDYNMYNELYLNHFIFNHLISEHNDQIKKGIWVKPS